MMDLSSDFKQSSVSGCFESSLTSAHKRFRCENQSRQPSFLTHHDDEKLENSDDSISLFLRNTFYGSNNNILKSRTDKDIEDVKFNVGCSLETSFFINVEKQNNLRSRVIRAVKNSFSTFIDINKRLLCENDFYKYLSSVIKNIYNPRTIVRTEIKALQIVTFTITKFAAVFALSYLFFNIHFNLNKRAGVMENTINRRKENLVTENDLVGDVDSYLMPGMNILENEMQGNHGDLIQGEVQFHDKPVASIPMEKPLPGTLILMEFDSESGTFTSTKVKGLK